MNGELASGVVVKKVLVNGEKVSGGVVSALRNETLLRRLTSTIVAGEALLLFFLALFLIAESFLSKAKNVDALLAEIFFAILGGIALLVAARGIRRGKRYGNSPALLANLIALAVAYYIFEGGWPGISILLGFFAVLAVLGILRITSLQSSFHEEA